MTKPQGCSRVDNQFEHQQGHTPVGRAARARWSIGARRTRRRASAVLAIFSAAMLMTGLVFVQTSAAVGTLTVTPNAGLTNGQTVTVSWTGRLPNQSPIIEQCNGAPVNPTTDCDFLTLQVAESNGVGAGSDTFNVFAGDGPSHLFSCDSQHACTTRVADDFNDISSGVVAPVTFSTPPLPTVSVGDATVVEGDVGTKSAAFSVRLSAPSAVAVTLLSSTGNGTATSTAPADYTAKTAQLLTIAAGATNGSIKVPVLGDGRVEADETFFVTISSPTNAALGRSSAIGTIVNDDGPTVTPRVSIGDVSVVEGNAGTSTAIFDVTLDQTSATTVSVPWSTAPGTATATADYTAASGTVAFPAGTTSKTVSVTVKGDALPEVNEAAVVNLGVPVGAVVARGVGQLTIVDDDTTPSATAVSVGNAAVVEGDTLTHSATFTVRLAQAAAGAVTVNYVTTVGTATATTDYTTKTGVLTIAAGAVSGKIAVPVVADGLTEATETFTVTLSLPTGGATLGRTTGTGTIIDDDPVTPLTVGIGDASSGEGHVGTAPMVVVVTLSRPSAVPVTVLVNSANVTATSGSDYTAVVNKLVTIPAGTVSANVSITITGDVDIEPDDTFTLALSAPTGGAVLGRTTGTGRILNDD